MRKALIFLTLFMVISPRPSLFGQTISILDLNNVRAVLMDNGYFFNHCSIQVGGYEIPKGSGNQAIYTSSFWFGAKDVNNQLKVCAPSYCSSNSNSDLWAGPLDVNTGNAIVPNPFSQTYWTVNSWDISSHIANSQSNGYVMPASIANWPAHGDITVGADYYLAPFVDENNNGIYDPQNGDYPCIKGDKATYMIMNDAFGTHGSGGEIMNIELHFMFYQYLTNSFLNNSTFIDLKVINRGTQTLNDFNVSYFVDGDLGNYSDDYVGSDSTKNLMYTYNGDNSDEGANGDPGYGSIPPAIGVISLGNTINSVGVYSSNSVTPYNFPSNPIEIFNSMNAQWQNGTRWQDNNGNTTNFMYYGSPNNSSEWSEVSASNIPGDRRMVMNIKNGDLAPSEYYTLSYAVVYGKGTDYLSSVTNLLLNTDSIQAFYNQLSYDCFDPMTVSLNEINFIEFEIYPNPSTGQFNLDFPKTYNEVEIIVKDAFGRIVFTENKTGVNQFSFDLKESRGIYFVTILTEEGKKTKKMIIN